MTVALLSVESACILYISPLCLVSGLPHTLKKLLSPAYQRSYFLVNPGFLQLVSLDESCWDVVSHQFIGECPEVCPKLFSR